MTRAPASIHSKWNQTDSPTALLSSHTRMTTTVQVIILLIGEALPPVPNPSATLLYSHLPRLPPELSHKAGQTRAAPPPITFFFHLQRPILLPPSRFHELALHGYRRLCLHRHYGGLFYHLLRTCHRLLSHPTKARTMMLSTCGERTLSWKWSASKRMAIQKG
jgi:hypothetical protein